MCEFIVTDSEIKVAEGELLKGVAKFNDEQISFIKCLDSCFLQAYAGTGKTTALVAKLHVLAQKEIWNDGRGICIISHTNVAIDEVKKHVAVHYPDILQYPNFVGTIQEFVNTFLFIPYLASQNMQIGSQADKFIYQHNFPLLNQLKVQTKKAIMQASVAYEKSLLLHRIFFQEKLRFDGKDFPFAAMNKKRTSNKLPLEAESEINEYFGRVTALRRRSGKFLFDESFIDSLTYLNQHPIVKRILSERFRYVFVDEAQDCSEFQLQLLNSIFDKGRSVLQQIGDVNQSISEQAWVLGTPRMELGNSTRFGREVQDFINAFRIDSGQGLRGSDNTTQKTLLIYPESEKSMVLDEYAKLILSKKIPHYDGHGYYAIACVKEPISEFYSDYSPISNQVDSKYGNLNTDADYINLLTQANIKKYGSYFVSNILFKLLYKHYKSTGNWNELRTIIREGEHGDLFRKLVYDVSRQLMLGENISKITLIEGLNIILGEQKIHDEVSISGTDQATNSNTYVSSLGPAIKLGSIHSVKGQTHNATMLLSIKTHGKQDLQHTITNSPTYGPQYKRLIYVAASRSKDLFVFAISAEDYNKITDKSIFRDFETVEIKRAI